MNKSRKVNKPNESEMVLAIIEAAKNRNFSDKIESVEMLSYYGIDFNNNVKRECDRFDYIDDKGIVHFIGGTGYEGVSCKIGQLTNTSIKILYDCITQVKTKELKVKMLFNKSLREFEKYCILCIDSSLFDKCDPNKLKKLIRESITDRFNSDVYEIFNGNGKATQEEIDYCINELSLGHASNIGDEDFWWATDYVITEL